MPREKIEALVAFSLFLVALVAISFWLMATPVPSRQQDFRLMAGEAGCERAACNHSDYQLGN